MIKRGPPAKYPIRYPNSPVRYPNRFPVNVQRKPMPNFYEENFLKKTPQGNSHVKDNPNKDNKTTKLLAVIAAIFILLMIIFIVVKAVSKDDSDKKDNLNKFTADLKIYNVLVVNESSMSVVIENPSNITSLVSVLFVFYNYEGEKVNSRKVPIEDIKEAKFNVVFNLKGSSEISRIELIPIFIDKSGKEVQGKVADEFFVEQEYQENETVVNETVVNESGELGCKSNLDCEDFNGCTIDTCNSGECDYEIISNCASCGYDSHCDDLNACTANKCDRGRCNYIQTPGCMPCSNSNHCEDNDVCTDNICMNGRCLFNSRTNCENITDEPLNPPIVIPNGTLECTSLNDCEDYDSCTRDSCTNNKCFYSDIKVCIYNDGCCPSGCNSLNDNDCSSVCGNNLLEEDELCDGMYLDGNDCSTLRGEGYTGTLLCSDCMFNASKCVAPCRDTCESLGYECGIRVICNEKVTCGYYNGGCPTDYSCKYNGTCMKSCIPKTCSALGRNCGTVSDGCGDILTCGNYNGGCPTGYDCSSNGVCVQNCVPSTCNSLGRNCGTVSDGCGDILTCGNYNGGCPTGYDCSSNGVCVQNCVPSTCNLLGRNCGTVSDGCGDILTCGNYNGGCQSGYTCSNGVCVGIPSENIKYVSKNGIDSSSRDGSPGQEWASLSYACSRVKTSGYLIHVNPGNYIDNNKCDLAVGVSIEGDINSPPTITTSYTYGVSKIYGYIELNSPAGNAVNGGQSISYINFNGNSKDSYRAIAVNYRGNVEVHHCNFSYFRLSGVTFHGTNSNWNVEPQNTLPTGNEVHDCVFVSCANLHRSETNLWEPGHIRPEGQSGMKIYNNIFYQKDQAEGYNADIITGYQNDGLKLYNNVFYKNDIEGDEWNFFYEMHYHRGGIEIYNNRFYGASTLDFAGTVKGKYDFGGKIYNNSFIANSIPPTNDKHQGYIDVETFTYVNDLYIYNNYFKNARTGIHINNAQISMNNIWVYNNIIEGVGNSDNSYSNGITVEANWGDNTPTPIDNIYIYNNVITAAKSTYAGIFVSAGGDISNLNIKNNIIGGSFSNPIRINDRDLDTSINGLNINNNLFYGTSSSSISYSSDLNYINRNDNGNLANVNPLFVGGSPYNFRLTSSSPARGKGIYVGLDKDYAGQIWNNPPSIGAYEYK